MARQTKSTGTRKKAASGKAKAAARSTRSGASSTPRTKRTAAPRTGKPRPARGSRPRNEGLSKVGGVRRLGEAGGARGGNGELRTREDAPRKTRLKPEELEEFRQMLIDKRRELLGDVAHLESEARHQNRGSGATSSSMPIHMADLGSDTWEQELTFGLIENERGLLREIDEALERIENKTYGVCLATNKPIKKARLRAQPWAKYCIEYARKRELGLA